MTSEQEQCLVDPLWMSYVVVFFHGGSRDRSANEFDGGKVFYEAFWRLIFLFTFAKGLEMLVPRLVGSRFPSPASLRVVVDGISGWAKLSFDCGWWWQICVPLCFMAVAIDDFLSSSQMCFMRAQSVYLNLGVLC